jgi:predicted DNA-binding transcriptional regulator YafY
MDRPTTRVLAILELLQARGTVSGAELSQRLGVDRRTVRRYIAQLEELGLPITAERGRNGGYALVAGFKLPPLMFTEDEAVAVALGLVAARGLGLAAALPAVSSAQAKLERVMPEPLRRRARALDETVAVELAGPVAPAAAAALASLSEAAEARRRVFLAYRSATGSLSERDFDAYALAYRAGCWYTVGFCHLRGGLRSFRIDRITTVTPRAERFDRPADFDVLEHLARAVASLPRAHAVEVWIEASEKAVKKILPQALGVLEPVGDGLLLFAQADDLDWLARELARLPFRFEVRRPAALAAALATLGRRLVSEHELRPRPDHPAEEQEG